MVEYLLVPLICHGCFLACRITWSTDWSEMPGRTSPDNSDHCWPRLLGFWNNRFRFNKREVLPHSSRTFPRSITGKFTTAKAPPHCPVVARLWVDRHLNQGGFEKQRSRGVPGLCPAGTAHAQALTNWPLAATSVHRPAPQRQRYCWKYNTHNSKNSDHRKFVQFVQTAPDTRWKVISNFCH